MADEQAAGETIDRSGTRVVLLLRVWQEKIVKDHPEIARHMADILAAVSHPHHVVPDPLYPERVRCYAQGVGPSRWLLVVVSYEQEPARIVSAFANRKDPRSWSA